MSYLENKLVGVPTASRKQLLCSLLKGYWNQHRDRLEILKDKQNPLYNDVLLEISEWKKTATAVLEDNIFQPVEQGYGYATRLVSLNVPDVVALLKWNTGKRKYI